MLSLMFLLPFETALQVLRAILLPVLLLYPLGTTLLGMLMVNRLRREMMHEELRISEERLRLVGKAANIGYFIRDLITNQEQYSLEWKQQLGYEDEEIKNDVNEWLSRVHPDDLPQVKTRIESCIHNHQPYYEAEYRLRHKDGSFRWILARGYLHYNDAGKATHLLGCHIDLTQQKQIEEQIRKLNTELDQRVHDRTAQLEAANQELEAFAYSVSHDLRAPLRAMDGFSAALLEGYSDSLDEQGKLFLKRIQEASRRMAQLINDLLNLSRVTRLDFKRQQVNLSQLAHEIAESLCAQNPDRNLQFQIDKEMIVEGDAQLLRIVLDNLLGNAVKFTSIRSDAVISFGYIDNQPNGRVYFVRDNGVGFNMEYANKLFAPFQRLHNNNDFPGTGIGLATVKRIITRHGGKIWTDAQEGEGAAFYFTLGEI